MQPDAERRALSTSLPTPYRCQKSVGSARMHKVYLLLGAHCQPARSFGSTTMSRSVCQVPSDGLGPEKTPPMMKPNRAPLELRVSDQESLLPEGGRARIVGPCRAGRSRPDDARSKAMERYPVERYPGRSTLRCMRPGYAGKRREIPGELYRRVKAKSVLEGRPVRAVPVELLPHLRGGTVGAGAG